MLLSLRFNVCPWQPRWSMAIVLLLFACPALADSTAERRTGETAILEALREEASIDFVDVRLCDVVESLSSRHRVEMLIDDRALADVNLSADSPVTIHVRNITLRSALNLILRDLDCSWIITDDVLLITTRERAERHLMTRVYDVGELVAAEDADDDSGQNLDSLLWAITATIRPESWGDLGGCGSVAPLEYRGAAVLIVRQTRDIHAQIAKLMDDLTRLADNRQPKPKTCEAAILVALGEKTSIDFVDTPLSDVVESLRRTHGVEMFLDRCALADVSQAVDIPVTVSIRNVKLRSALNLLLGPLDLTWTIRDEVLFITTPEEAELYTYARVYDVTDLAKVVDTNGHVVRPDFDSLMSVIYSSVQPASWPDSGGGISPLQCRGASVLVVHETREVHEEIAQLLADLETTADKYGDDVFPVHRRIWDFYAPGPGGF